MNVEEAFFKVNLEALKEELAAGRYNPDAYWNDRNLLNTYIAFVYDNTRLMNVNVALTPRRRYELDRAEILFKEILYRMGNK